MEGGRDFYFLFLFAICYFLVLTSSIFHISTIFPFPPFSIFHLSFPFVICHYLSFHFSLLR